jgi:hypothetical protein
VAAGSALHSVASGANYVTLFEASISKFKVPKVVMTITTALNKTTSVADAINDDIENNMLGLETSLLTTVADADVPYAVGQVLYQTYLVPLGNYISTAIDVLNEQFYNLLGDPITGPSQ